MQTPVAITICLFGMLTSTDTGPLLSGPVFCEAPVQQQRSSFDLDALAYAVAVAETSNCTKGVALSKRNCFGIKKRGEFVTYETHDESFAAFKEMWPRVYGDRFPTEKDAKKYAGTDDPSSWLGRVRVAYDRALRVR